MRKLDKKSRMCCSGRNEISVALSSIEGEIIVRIFLTILFVVTEDFQPFTRIIHKEEFWILDNPRTPSYYPTWMLVTSGFFVPFLIIYLYSYCRMEKDEAVKGWLAVSFSSLFTAILTNLIKNIVGRPRPDFMNRCFPDGIPETPFAQDGVTLLCTGNDGEIREGRKSFPSGHSSIMFSSIGFLTFYLAFKLQVNSPLGRSQAWRLLLTSLPFVFCLLVALSRTCDYHHHWQDVTVGASLGFFIAYLSFRQYMWNSSNECSPTKRMRKISVNPQLICENCQCQLVAPPTREENSDLQITM